MPLIHSNLIKRYLTKKVYNKLKYNYILFLFCASRQLESWYYLYHFSFPIANEFIDALYAIRNRFEEIVNLEGRRDTIIDEYLDKSLDSIYMKINPLKFDYDQCCLWITSILNRTYFSFINGSELCILEDGNPIGADIVENLSHNVYDKTIYIPIKARRVYNNYFSNLKLEQKMLLFLTKRFDFPYDCIKYLFFDKTDERTNEQLSNILRQRVHRAKLLLKVTQTNIKVNEDHFRSIFEWEKYTYKNKGYQLSIKTPNRILESSGSSMQLPTSLLQSNMFSKPKFYQSTLFEDFTLKMCLTKNGISHLKEFEEPTISEISEKLKENLFRKLPHINNNIDKMIDKKVSNLFFNLVECYFNSPENFKKELNKFFIEFEKMGNQFQLFEGDINIILKEILKVDFSTRFFSNIILKQLKGNYFRYDPKFELYEDIHLNISSHQSANIGRIKALVKSGNFMIGGKKHTVVTIFFRKIDEYFYIEFNYPTENERYELIMKLIRDSIYCQPVFLKKSK